MHDLITLETAKRMLKIGTSDTADDARIQRIIRSATGYIAMYTGRWFVPERETRVFDARGEFVQATLLNVRADLLAVESLTNGDGTTITPGQIALQPRNGYPKWAVELRPNAGITFVYTDDWMGALEVDGWWGYHDHYDRAWIDTRDTVQNNPLTAGATTITVADADGLNELGRTRFEVLLYLQLGDEVVQVTAINTSTNVLTVARGALGTTAAAHNAATVIRSYQPMADVEHACAALVAWFYRMGPTQGEKIQLMNGTAIIANEAPQNIKQTLATYVRRGVT